MALLHNQWEVGTRADKESKLSWAADWLLGCIPNPTSFWLQEATGHMSSYADTLSIKSSVAYTVCILVAYEGFISYLQDMDSCLGQIQFVFIWLYCHRKGCLVVKITY